MLLPCCRFQGLPLRLPSCQPYPAKHQTQHPLFGLPCLGSPFVVHLPCFQGLRPQAIRRFRPLTDPRSCQEHLGGHPLHPQGLHRHPFQVRPQSCQEIRKRPPWRRPFPFHQRYHSYRFPNRQRRPQACFQHPLGCRFQGLALCLPSCQPYPAKRPFPLRSQRCLPCPGSPFAFHPPCFQAPRPQAIRLFLGPLIDFQGPQVRYQGPPLHPQGLHRRPFQEHPLSCQGHQRHPP